MRVRRHVLVLVLPICLSWPFIVGPVIKAVADASRADARTSLSTSLAELRAGNYSFLTVWTDGSVEGVVYLPSRSAYLRRVALNGDRDPVVTADKVTISPADPDVTGATDLVAAARTGRWEGGKIVGELDATRVRRPPATFPPDRINQLGEAAHSVPYTAELDDAGRLTSIVLTVGEIGAEPPSRWILSINDYGHSLPQ